MDLSTTYLGLKLRTPLVPSASPLSEKLGNIKRMEDAGASAVIFHSLFEEQLRPANHPMRRGFGNGGEFSSDALDDYSEEPDFKVDPEAYIRPHRESEGGGAHPDHRQLEWVHLWRLATVCPTYRTSRG